MRFTPILLLAFACGKGDSAPVNEADTDTDADADADTDTDTDADTDVPPEPCSSTVTQIWPENGAVNVLPDSPIEVRYDTPITAANAWSVSIGGIAGQAALLPDGTGATFTPDAPLPHDATLTVSALVCDAAATSTFTTVHEPLPAASVEGRTYAVDYGSIDFVTPSIANTLTPADWILIQVREVDEVAQTLSAVAGLGNEPLPVPDCANSFDAGLADFSSNPQFTVGPTDFILPFGVDLVTIEDFEVQALIGPGGGTLIDIVLLGALDTRGITQIDNVCQLSAILGSPCQACRDGVNRCLPVFAEAPQGDNYPGVDVIGTCGL
jgi:hypothetical protein